MAHDPKDEQNNPAQPEETLAPQSSDGYVPDLFDEIAGDLSGKSRTYGYALIDDM